MKLEITVTGDTPEHLGEALQHAIEKIGQGIKGGESKGGATDDWYYNVKCKGKRVTVVYGDWIEFGEMRKGDDFYEMTILHEPYQVEEMYEEDIEEVVGNQSWFIMEQYNGEILTHTNPLYKGVTQK